MNSKRPNIRSNIKGSRAQRALRSKKFNPDQKFQSWLENFNPRSKFSSATENFNPRSFHFRGPRSVQKRARSKKIQSAIDHSKFSIPKAAIEFFQSPGPLGGLILRTNVQQLTCNIDLSNYFYYLFFSFVLIALKPFVLKGKVPGEKL